MKKLILTFIITLGFTINSNAQIQSMAGPRLGVTLIGAGETADILTGNNDGPSTFTTQYGWQWESRFADGGNITGLAEWVVLLGGMERGKFLPSISSLIGFRTVEGFEAGMGPNLTLAGIGMVFGMGFTATSGKLNMPFNIVFSPSKDNDWIESGPTFSILVGFNIATE